jgi:predicted TPR repeat methyltransferase
MLGDFQKEAGEREKARASYERGLELRPDAPFIQQKLSALEEEP